MPAFLYPLLAAMRIFFAPPLAVFHSPALTGEAVQARSLVKAWSVAVRGFPVRVAVVSRQDDVPLAPHR